MGQKQRSLEDEIATIYKTICFEKPKEEVVKKLEYYLLRHIKEIIAESFKRSLRRDPSSNSLAVQDIIYTIKDDQKMKNKISRSLILCQLSGHYEKPEKMKTHIDEMAKEVLLKKGEYETDDIEEQEKE